MVGKVPVPKLFEEFDRRLRGHLGEPHLVGDLVGLGVGVADDERRGRQDEQLVAASPVAGEAALDVGVERLPGAQGAVSGEDRVGGGGGEISALVGIAGLEDHRATLRASRNVEPAVDVEMRVLVGELAGVRVGQEDAAFLVRHDLVAAPGVEKPRVVRRNVFARS